MIDFWMKFRMYLRYFMVESNGSAYLNCYGRISIIDWERGFY